MPVRKFTAPEPSAFSVHTCPGTAVSAGLPGRRPDPRPGSDPVVTTPEAGLPPDPGGQGGGRCAGHEG